MLNLLPCRQLQDLFKLIKSEHVPYFFLGHGSNILVSDEGFDGIVIRPQEELSKIERKNNILRAGSAARLLDLTCLAAQSELSGMEALCGIPGSVGGGLWMNAGAYGSEICDTLVDVKALTQDHQIITLTKAEISFAYRSAPELHDVLIIEGRFSLARGEKLNIFSEMRRVWKLRREKQPLEYPSAGSVFKRPKGDYAGRLIEAVGGKGLRIGGAMVPYKHAGIFVNYGACTAKDMSALIREIRRRVYLQFGILLENEVKPVGFTNDPFEIKN